MKKLRTSFLIVFILFLSLQLSSQTAIDINRLNQLKEQFMEEWDQSQQRVTEYSQVHNIPVSKELEDGRMIQLIDVVDGRPIYYTTHNRGAAITTRANELWEGGSSGLDITGAGYNQLGEWDAGAVRVSHQEFTDQGESRVTQMDDPPSTHYHATHVAGTLIAAGVESNAKGMAYEGTLKAWDWTGDNMEMAEAAANGLEISNHSYGQINGWDFEGEWIWYGNENVSPVEEYRFGFYGGSARSWDLVAEAAPNYLIVKSAGNDRGDGPGDAGQNGKPERDGGTDGYDCIGDGGNAKNIMTIGAVRQVSEYTGPESVVMSGFSSWGPSDDGRIKPDIVGKGVSVYSSMDGSDTHYANLGGTSMSSPNVAGSLALLQQYYQDVNDGVPMRSATLKALVLHTADEAGAHPGPDYKFGWGLMNTLRASDVITGNIESEQIHEYVLEGGDLFIKEIYVPEGSDLRLTLCWTDPAGIPVTFQLNPRDPMLINDLDISIRDEAFNIYYPYSLDPENPSAAATSNSKNGVDNVEMIFIPNATAGNYTITITHDGWLENQEQAFSLIITGTGEEEAHAPECSADLTSPENEAENILLNEWISWQKSELAATYDVYFGTDSDGTTTPSDIYNGETFVSNGFDYIYLDPGTTYYLQVIPVNEVGPAESCDQIWSFTSMDAIENYPYTESISETTIPDLPEGWQTIDNSGALWFSTDQAAYEDEQSMICSKPESIVETNIDNWFISPPFSVKTGFEYELSFQYVNANIGSPESIKVFWGYMPFSEDLTNLIFSDESFDESDWVKGSGQVHPEEDQLLYFGFHVENEQGYGVFLDQIVVENLGAEGVKDRNFSDNVQVYAAQGKIIIDANDELLGSEIRITNSLGQEVYRDKYSGNTEINVQTITQRGLYIVTLFDGKKSVSKKVIVR